MQARNGIEYTLYNNMITESAELVNYETRPIYAVSYSLGAICKANVIKIYAVDAFKFKEVTIAVPILFSTFAKLFRKLVLEIHNKDNFKFYLETCEQLPQYLRNKIKSIYTATNKYYNQVFVYSLENAFCVRDVNSLKLINKEFGFILHAKIVSTEMTITICAMKPNKKIKHICDFVAEYTEGCYIKSIIFDSFTNDFDEYRNHYSITNEPKIRRKAYRNSLFNNLLTVLLSAESYDKDSNEHKEFLNGEHIIVCNENDNIIALSNKNDFCNNNSVVRIRSTPKKSINIRCDTFYNKIGCEIPLNNVYAKSIMGFIYSNNYNVTRYFCCFGYDNKTQELLNGNIGNLLFIDGLFDYSDYSSKIIDRVLVSIGRDNSVANIHVNTKHPLYKFLVIPMHIATYCKKTKNNSIRTYECKYAGKSSCELLNSFKLVANDSNCYETDLDFIREFY